MVANTAQAAAGAGTYAGSHPVGDRLVLRGRAFPNEPAYVEVTDVRPGEVVVLVRQMP